MSTYETDFYGWTQETAELLKQGRFSEVDMEALIEEVEDMGTNKIGQLENRLIVLIAHLLKWQYQPEHRSNSWRATIEDQRIRIHRLIMKNPSLKPRFIESILEAYPIAVLRAVQETNLAKSTFPASFERTGWRIEQVLDEGFYPG
ncbi:hypothetical conserved protein [Candidatus Nitrosoglobus terrae]|uniref:Hypothetical conserved protein n=1 Tax=Candidatus Nitrosoglobus terrae TaxID=1630141 RepID=A0A1Q2SKQ6_9GAMM|nr:DUF29 domain-containing protein [Candidatus Nitrosoglobus terrae]BAW79693.1 hypothetical conserved protein [Candidatus Nitrosoglobus terrae]